MKSIKNNLYERISFVILVGVLLVSFGLRVYRIDSIPPSLSWDEVAVGYNAYTIANYGRDEYGKFFPASFTSFGDDKSPVHVYFTALIVKLLGLSDFSVRLGSAIFGVLSVLLIFLLLVEMFGSRMLGLVGSTVLAVSPYNLQFSRFNHEANFALGFYLLGLWLFFKSLKDGFWLPFSVFMFCLSLFSYHSAKIVVPITLCLLTLFYGKIWLNNRIGSFFSAILIIGTILVYVMNPALLGLARANQTAISIDDVRKMPMYSLVEHGETIFPKNQAVNVTKLWLILQRYMVFFQPNFLYLNGDLNLKFSTQFIGQFYRLDIAFLIFGVIYLIKLNSKKSYVLIILALTSPIPAAVVGGSSEIGHSGRALYIMGTWTLIIAVGIYGTLVLFNGLKGRFIFGIVICVVYLVLITQYIKYYYVEYPVKSAIEWQYGMKQIVEYTNLHPEYSTIYVTSIRSQPYIFFLYYLKYPLFDYLDEVEFDPTNQRPHNNVYSFGKYHFGDWDQIQSMPYPNVLYVVEPSIYSGLLHKSDFDVKKLIKYPNGNDAFYLVAAKGY